jgi:U3 small nucleolar RNA-associated protein 4
LKSPLVVLLLTFAGPDASPTVVPLGQYGFENQRSLPFLPQEPTIRSAPRKRLMMSWWDREVHIWRLSKPSKSATALEDLEDEPTAQSRKLVAKILIKGEANITSAALSTDGNLLAVSTTTDIKVFQLRARRPEEGDGLRIAKVTVPSSFSSGARLLQFSPDGKWLCIVRPDGHVVLGRISLSTSSTITINAPLSKLSRLDRQIEKFVTLGGLGTYDRIITQAAFSWDSRILAVSDLAGYIDTFVLSGTEDLTQIPSEEDASSSESASEDSDEDSDSEEEPNPKTIFGQYWTRNPSASSLPKLPSTPVILSFRPAATPSQKALTNGAVPHATRNNPHPVSHELPAGEDRLLVLTATSDVFEFEVLKGGLSAWSRRNPTAAFPEKFRMNRDQARGVIWDISPKNGKERVWLYGIGWLWMFDFSQDLPPPKSSNQLLTNGDINGENGVEAEDEEVAATPSKKRKRNIKGQRKGTGAGDAVPNHRLETGIGRKMMRVVYEEEGGTHRIIPGTSDAMDIDEDDDDADQVSALERLRRGDDAETGEEGEEEGEGEKAYDWSTLKYRPILGMCVIGERGEDDDELEVAIVERPIWEVDLPPAYYGDQEWIKKDH